MDQKYGRVLEALESNGLTDNTLVFCFADHGLQFPRNMCNLTDQGSRVYLIIRGPGGFTGGAVVDSLVSLIDLAPTAYDVAGIDCPNFVEGISLRPSVEGKSEIRSEVFCEVNYHAAYEPMRSVRTERYKYIRRYDGRVRHVLPNMDDTPSKAFMLDHDWEAYPRDQEMLYDLIFDPHEANNMIADPARSGVLTDLRSRLNRWMAETGDPLLVMDPVKAPRGSKVNNVDGRSPRDEPELMD
jgi:arylsulfatase A-like enzyme